MCVCVVITFKNSTSPLLSCNGIEWSSLVWLAGSVAVCWDGVR